MRKRLLRVLTCTVAVAIACATAGCTPVGTTGPLTGNYAKNIWGPDVSGYQHPTGQPIDWFAVARQGAKFAFVKMSEGSYYTNPWATTDIRSARAAGLYVGAYHFARPRFPLSTATADAQRFAAQIGNVRQPGYLPPVLDMEATGGLSAANLTSWTRQFLAALQTFSGRVPMIYSGGWFWQGYMGNPQGFSQYPVWIAQYTPGDIGPNLFGDFGYSTFWQYGDTALVSGIIGRVDTSWFHGTVAQLSSLAYVSVPTKTTQSARALIDTIGPTTSPGSQTTSGDTTGSMMAQSPSTVGSK